MQRLREVSSSLLPRKGDERILGTVNLVYAIGRGVFLSGSVLYFKKVTGLSAAEIGIGSSAAALSGFAASLLFGVLSDRLGAKRVLILLFLVQALGFSLYPAIHEAKTYYILIVAVGFVEFGVGPSLGALVGSLTEPEERVRVRAVLRSMFNMGFSCGSGITAAALLGGRVFQALPWCTSALLVIAFVLICRLPKAAAAARPQRVSRFSALGDVKFVGLTVLSTPLALYSSIILVALPLWTVTRTHAPSIVVPLLVIANTVMAIVFQVPASRGADTVRGAARLGRRAGIWQAAACVAAATATLGGAVVASLALCLAMVLFTLAELQQSASGWGLAHGLAPEHAQGEYLGTFNLHIVLQAVIGPSLVSTLALKLGPLGWGIVAAGILAAGFALVPLARAARPPVTAEHQPEPEPA
jgi:MFS family permease